MKYIQYIILFVLLSCNQEEKKTIYIDDNNFKELTFRGKAILSERQFTIHSHDTFINGSSKEYYKSGSLKSEAFYKMGIKDSVEIEYFEGGSMASIRIRDRGRPAGKQVEYYENGSVKNLSLSNGKDTNLFHLTCLKNGSVISISGIPLYQNANRKNLSIGDEFVLVSIVIKDKNISPILNLKLISPLGKVVLDSTITDFKSKNHNDFFIFKGKFSGVGNYGLLSTVKLLDNNKRVIIEDRISDTIRVKK